MRQQPHLKNVPDYIIPHALKKASIKSRRKRLREQKDGGGNFRKIAPMSQAKRKFHKRKADPLKNLK